MDEQNVCFADSQTTDVSDTNSVDSAKVECPPPTQTRICLIGDLCKDPKISQAAQSFGVPVVISETGREFLNDGTCDTVFVVENFSGPVFNAIHQSEMRILGPTALQECAQKGEGLPSNTRPLYSLAMSGLVICFTGFRKKDELNRLILLIHHMGGSIRKDMASKVTHLIANSCGGEKYRYAITFCVPIMSEAWVDACWEKRDCPGVSAVSEEMMEHKLKPFHGAHVCFYGFSDEERLHMTEVLQENGGIPVELEDPRCSHVVVDGGETYDLLKANVVVPRKIFPSVRKTSTPVSNHAQSMPDCSSKPPKIPRRSVTPRNSEMVRRSSRRHKSSSEIKVSTNNVSTSSIGMLNQDFNHSDIFNNSKCLERSSSTPSTSRITSSSIGCFSSNASSSSELFCGKLWDDNTSSSMLWLCDAPSVRGRMATPEQAVPKHSSRSCPSVNRRASYDGHESGTVPDGVFKEPGPRRLSLGIGTRNRVTPSPGFILSSRHPPLSCGNPPIVEEENALTAPVVDESEVQSIPEKAPLRAPIVKAEWFWASVQNEGCADEKEYLFEDYLEALLSPSNRLPSQHSTPASRARKRKRLRDAVSRLVQIDSPAIHKRRSSVSDAALLSMSGSFLDDDHTLSPEKPAEGEGESSTETPRKSASPRRQVFLELVQTEANYVGILHTIMTLFKVPLEEMAETNSPLLNNTELKIIFGNLPPIYEVHCHMLEELKWLASHWKEDCSIGKIILKYAPDLMKAYPPFVNFFENTREMLVNCDQSKPRFHAFLKIGQTRSECGRQTLQELLIRPVQRLPSISLLLSDILKHTPKSNSDHTALEQALAAIREVMTHINEDKRKTEGQLVMFDIFNDIDNCPPHLVSSHRNFIVRCDVMELSDGLSGRGDSLVLFLFSDILEVCKKRSKVFNSLKSPNSTTGSLHSVKMSNGKPFKHIRLMALSSIRHVFDIHETDDCHNVFALRCRSNQELKEKLYLFMLADEETDKLGFLRTLCRQMANTMCKTDAENFLTSVDSQSLNIDTTDINSGTLSKAFKFASRTRIKVGRAFSFNKTPSKLKRAVSTMMSPFGSTTNLTPASQLAQMRLASCNNLSELSSSPLKGESSYIAPMSVQPTRKNKSASLNVMSLRRL